MFQGSGPIVTDWCLTLDDNEGITMHRSFPTRRSVLHGSAIALAGGFWVRCAPAVESRSPNERLNFAHIGVGGQGSSDFGVSAGHNVVAICDVDDRELKRRAERVGGDVASFHDYRKMYDKMMNRIDAVVIATPDHQHALASLMAIRNGKHVYTEKPLAHSVHECFLLGAEAKKPNVKTQMGNAAHPDYQFRRAKELIDAGLIGKVTEVHVNNVRASATKWPAGLTTALRESDPPDAKPPIPSYLDWDLWLGGADERDYHPDYCPKRWRGWRDFGTGGIGDFFCHHADPAFTCLDLTHPVSIEAAGSSKPIPSDRAPGGTFRFMFAARGDQPAVTLYWHGGGSGPPAEIVDVDAKDPILDGLNCLMIGDKGAMAVGRGNGQADPVLFPRARFRDVKLPPTTLGSVVGHKQQLAHCVRHGGLPGSNFQERASYLSACALLGHVAYWSGQKIEWDGPNLRVTNVPDANRFIRKSYRKGWEVA